MVGHHDGLMYHTLGQRKGLGIGGVKGMGEDPFYVVEKDLVNNVLVVAQGHDNSALLSSQFHREPVTLGGSPTDSPASPLHRQNPLSSRGYSLRDSTD